MRSMIKSSAGSPKTVSNKYSDFIKKVEEDLGCEIIDDDGKFLTIEIDNDVFEAEYTRYSDGDYELMHYNLHKTGSKNQPVLD